MNAQLGPLNEDPRGVRPPYAVRDLDQVQHLQESVDTWRTRVLADKLAALLDPLDGIELGTCDRGVLAWLAGWDIPTVGTVASLLHRARQGAPAGVERGGQR